MTTLKDPGISWNKIWVIISAVGVPMVSILCTIIIWGTKIDAGVTSTKEDIKDMKADLKELHTQVDTISKRQHDQQMANYYEQKFGKRP